MSLVKAEPPEPESSPPDDEGAAPASGLTDDDDEESEDDVYVTNPGHSCVLLDPASSSRCRSDSPVQSAGCSISSCDANSSLPATVRRNSSATSGSDLSTWFLTRCSSLLPDWLLLSFLSAALDLDAVDEVWESDESEEGSSVFMADGDECGDEPLAMPDSVEGECFLSLPFPSCLKPPPPDLYGSDLLIVSL